MANNYPGIVPASTTGTNAATMLNNAANDSQKSMKTVSSLSATSTINYYDDNTVIYTLDTKSYYKRSGTSWIAYTPITNSTIDSTIKPGLLSDLITIVKDTFVNAINEVVTRISGITNTDGSLKTGLIVNENMATDVKIGSLSGLETTDKSSVTGAITELLGKNNANTTLINDLINRMKTMEAMLIKYLNFFTLDFSNSDSINNFVILL